MLRIDADFFFANIRFIHNAITSLIMAEDEPVYVLLLDLSPVGDMDFSAVTEMQKTIKWLRKRQMTLMATGVNGPVRDMLRKSGFIKLIGEENVFWLHGDAVKNAKKLIRLRREDLDEEEEPTELMVSNVAISHFGGAQRVYKFQERRHEHKSFWQKLI